MGIWKRMFSRLVYRFVKAFFELKQALKAWFSKLATCLLDIGFVSSKENTSLLIQDINNHSLVILVYTDDIIVTRNSSKVIQHYITTLDDNFKLKELRLLSYFLSIEGVFHNDNVLHLN